MTVESDPNKLTRPLSNDAGLIVGRTPRETVDLGDLGYWLQGSCFCIFFGPTPMSRGDEIRPASEVEVFGKLDGDPKEFKKVSSGSNSFPDFQVGVSRGPNNNG